MFDLLPGKVTIIWVTKGFISRDDYLLKQKKYLMSAKDQETKYQLLIRKLEDFSKRYYKNLLLRGSIFFSALFLFSILFVAITEHFGHFTTTTRTALFYIFLVVNLSALGYWIAIPLLQLFRLTQGLTNYQAARMIGMHFPEVKDKLLNTLQLYDNSKAEKNTASRDLIHASIAQRVEQLKPVPFSMAVNFKNNLTYLKYAAVPLVLILITFVANPSAILDSTQRVIDHRTHYEKEAPFTFKIQNDSLKAVRNQEFPVHLKLEGEQIPAEVFIEIDGNSHRMQPEENREFSYRIRNPQSNKRIQFYADGHFSEPFEVEVYPRPALDKFTVYLDYPSYTGMEPEEKQNIGDFSVPEGTEVTWIFHTRDVDKLLFNIQDSLMEIPPDKGREFSYTQTLTEDLEYSIRTANEYFKSEDTLTYYAEVIPDEAPQIQTEKQEDSLNPSQLYFMGEIGDDYGFTALTFNYRILESDQYGSEEGDIQRDTINIDRNETVQSFFYQWNTEQLNIGAGDQVEFYFTVWDNDRVNGPKATRSETYYHRTPTRRELAEEGRQQREETINRMDESISEISELRRELEEIEQELMGKDDMDWQDEDKIQELIDRHEELQQQLEEMSRNYQEQMQRQQQSGEMDQEMSDKHQRMQELLDELMDDDMKDLLQEMQDALDQQHKDRLQEKLRDLESQDRFSEREMDRIKELFKNLDFEQQLRDNIDDLRDMSQDQEDISERGQDEDATDEELSDRQEQLMEDFDDFQEKMQELEEQNEQLSNPKNMDDFEDQMGNIQQNLQDALEQLQQQDRDGAQENQNQGQQQMEEMAEQMQQMQMDMDMEMAFVNYESLRRILQNLVHFSFKQEELLEAFGEVEEHNPRFVELGQEQSRLSRYAGLIEDSLHALSMEIMEIGPIVNQEMNEINYHLEQARDNISDRRIGSIRRNQQSVMTSANNLAAMLSDILDNLQQQMAQQMEGEQMSQQMQQQMQGEPSMERMRELQQELGERMEEMQQNGEGGEGEEGEDGEMDSEEMDEEYARIAAEQQRLREQLRKMREMLEDADGEGGKELEEMEDDMEDVERDILHRKIDQETLEKHQEITVRMLEYEESEREQGQEDERQAEQADEYERISPQDLEEFFRQTDSNIERLKTTPPRLNSYYQNKVEDYFRNLTPEENAD